MPKHYTIYNAGDRRSVWEIIEAGERQIKGPGPHTTSILTVSRRSRLKITEELSAHGRWVPIASHWDTLEPIPRWPANTRVGRAFTWLWHKLVRRPTLPKAIASEKAK
jgi:hypothetical protein